MLVKTAHFWFGLGSAQGISCDVIFTSSSSFFLAPPGPKRRALVARPRLLPEIHGAIRGGWVSCSEVVLTNADELWMFWKYRGVTFPSVKGILQ